jgi:hypothetical protein
VIPGWEKHKQKGPHFACGITLRVIPSLVKLKQKSPCHKLNQLMTGLFVFPMLLKSKLFRHIIKTKSHPSFGGWAFLLGRDAGI